MPLDFYYMSPSPPCRSVMLTAKAVGVTLNLKQVNVMTGEHKKPEYLAINPQHTIPALVDGHVKICESRAICTYLASQYGKDDSLYPSNPKARCMVDQRLYFDMGTLFNRWSQYMFPLMGGHQPDPTKLEPVKEALGWLNDILKEYPWAAGNKITVADFCLVATVSTIEEVGVIDLEDYSRVEKWLHKCKKQMIGYKEANGDGAKMLGEFVKGKLEAFNPKKKESSSSSSDSD